MRKPSFFLSLKKPVSIPTCLRAWVLPTSIQKLNSDGAWYSLPPLRTENIKYARFPLLIVAGIGANVRLTERWSAGIELCNNFLSSDYLDDASTTYPQPDQLPGDLARRLSDRSSEIGQPPHTPGDIRANPKTNDSYIFLSIKANYISDLHSLRQNEAKNTLPGFVRGCRCYSICGGPIPPDLS